MAPKLYKAADVCVMARVQPYVLRSWEKEFPGIGMQQSPDGPRLYRQADVNQVLRIRQLVFEEGLTLAGARRRLETQPLPIAGTDAAGNGAGADMTEAPEALGDDARRRIATVRDGLRSILDLLAATPGTVAPAVEFALQPQAEDVRPPAAAAAATAGVAVPRGVAARRKRASA